MSRYIDADRLMLELNDWWYSQTKIESQNIPYDDNISVTIREAMEAVKEQPTADVVEVVRCKDCKWWKPFNDKMGYCGYEMRHKDFYCKRGERKEE